MTLDSLADGESAFLRPVAAPTCLMQSTSFGSPQGTSTSTCGDTTGETDGPTGRTPTRPLAP